MMELLAPYSTGLMILAIELMVVLFIIIFVVLFLQLKKRKNQSQIAEDFVENVQKGESARRNKLSEAFARNLGLEGEELEQKVKHFLDKETAFYKTMLTVFLSKEEKFLNKAYSDLSGVMDNWTDMVPEGIMDEEQIQKLNQDIVKLKEENTRMSGEIQNNHDEMEALMAEYNAAFNKGKQEEPADIKMSNPSDSYPSDEQTAKKNIQLDDDDEVRYSDTSGNEPDSRSDSTESTPSDEQNDELLDLSENEDGEVTPDKTPQAEQDKPVEEDALSPDDIDELFNKASEQHESSQNEVESPVEVETAPTESADQPSADEDEFADLPGPEDDEQEITAATEIDTALPESATQAEADNDSPDENLMDDTDIDSLMGLDDAADADAHAAEGPIPTAEPDLMFDVTADDSATDSVDDVADAGNVVSDAEIDDLLDLDPVEATIPDENQEDSPLETTGEQDIAKAEEEPQTPAAKTTPSPTESLIDNLDFDLGRAEDEMEILDITVAESVPEESSDDEEFLDITRVD